MGGRNREPEPGEELNFDEERSVKKRGEKRPKAPVRRKGDLQIDGTSSGVLETDRYFADFAGDALANREEIEKLIK